MTRDETTPGDRDRAIERLPTLYAVALRMRDAGAPDTLIAVGLGVDPRSLPPLLELAEAKLAAIEHGLGDQRDVSH